MRTLPDILAGLVQLLMALVYWVLTPLGSLLLTPIISMLVVGVILLVQSRGGSPTRSATRARVSRRRATYAKEPVLSSYPRQLPPRSFLVN